MDLVSFLEGLPPASLDDVYAAPYTAAALFRALPPVARQYVLRLLFVDKALAGGERMPGTLSRAGGARACPWCAYARALLPAPPTQPPMCTRTGHHRVPVGTRPKPCAPAPPPLPAVVSSWANPGETGKHAATLGRLQRLAVLARHSDALGAVSYSLNPLFRCQLRRAVCTRCATGLPALPQPPVPSDARTACPPLPRPRR